MQGDIRWVAQLADGRIIREWDFQGSWVHGEWLENAWSLLPVDQVVSFGIEGLGIRIGFVTTCGKLGINGKPLSLMLVGQDEDILPITDYPLARYRPHQYKQAAFDLGHVAEPVGEGRFRLRAFDRGPRIEAYVVGWRMEVTHAQYGRIEAELEAAVWPQAMNSIPIALRLSIERGFTGIFQCFYDGKPIASAHTILRPGRWNRIAIHVPIP